jgi:hypothetical protein
MNPKPHVQGRGMGAVVIRKGGPGAGSSYIDLEDYTHTTGINPQNHASDFSSRMRGRGISSKLSSRLSNLTI